MGVGWRRFTESIKQHAPVPSRFSPTSNERNEKTLEEAANVARKIKDVIADIENMNKASETSLRTLLSVLTSPAAQIYDFVGVTDAPSPVPASLSPTGSDVPSSPGSPLPEGVRTRRAGGVAPVGEARAFADVDGSAANSILEDHRAKLEEEVLRPLRAWLAAYEQLRKKNEEVEALRLEVDSRRRTVSELTVKAAKKEGKLQENADTKAEAALGQARDQLSHKSDKLRTAAGTYAQGEATLHEQLVALLDDARYVQAYATKATRFQADVLAQLATIIEGPVPAGSREGDGGISLQGFEQTHHIDNGLVAGGGGAAGDAAGLGAAAATPLEGPPGTPYGTVDPSLVPAEASAVAPFVHGSAEAGAEAAPDAASAGYGAAGTSEAAPGTGGALEQTTEGIQAASLHDDGAGGATAGGSVGKHYVDVEEPVAAHIVSGATASDAAAAPASFGKHYVDVEEPANVAPTAATTSPAAYGASSPPDIAAVSYDDPSGFNALGARANAAAAEPSPLATSAPEHAPHANPFEEPEALYAARTDADGKPTIPGL